MLDPVQYREYEYGLLFEHLTTLPASIQSQVTSSLTEPSVAFQQNFSITIRHDPYVFYLSYFLNE